MALATLEIGPPWKMELLRDVLEEHGVQAFVADANMKTIDPFVTGALALDARLQVPEEALEDARAALAEARAEGLELERIGADEEGGDADPGERPPERAVDPLADLAELGRRIRWASLLFWMHPFVFVYGVRYLRGIQHVAGRPVGHGLTLVALVLVGLSWSALLFGALLFRL